MIQQKEALEQLGARVLLVTYASPDLLQDKMMRGLEVPYPLLLDPEKRAYQAWGMGRTNLFGAMLSPSLNVRYAKLLLEGERFLGTPRTCFSWEATSSWTRLAGSRSCIS